MTSLAAPTLRSSRGSFSAVSTAARVTTRRARTGAARRCWKGRARVGISGSELQDGYPAAGVRRGTGMTHLLAGERGRAGEGPEGDGGCAGQCGHRGRVKFDAFGVRRRRLTFAPRASIVLLYPPVRQLGANLGLRLFGRSRCNGTHTWTSRIIRIPGF